MTCKGIFLLFIVFLSLPSQAQSVRKALFLGNSYTGFNNLPQLVHDVAASAGDSLVFDSNTPGGYTFEHHTLDNVSMNKIQSGGWDYVVLQGQSREPIINTGLFNQSATVLKDTIKTSNPCAVPMFYMTWGRKDGDAVFCGDFPVMCTYVGMDSALRLRYEQLADVFNSEVSPVSVVWRYLREHHPGIELYQQDGSHPTAAGSYAAACVFYTTLFKDDPTDITYDFGLNPNDALVIRATTKAVVFDSLAKWDYKVLPNSTFSYSIGAGTNEVLFNAPGFGAIQSHAWDFGDGNTSSLPSPTHNYATNGSFEVELTTSNCDVNGIHTSVNDTVIAFCEHTPTITTTHPWLCNYDTLWTQPADAYQWYTQNEPIPETGSFIAHYAQYNSQNFSVLTTVNGCSELSQEYVANPEWSGFYFDAAWGGDPCEGDTALFIVKHFNGELPDSSIILWYRDGELLSGETNEDTLLITTEGIYLCQALDPSSNCPKDTTIFHVEYDCSNDSDSVVGLSAPRKLQTLNYELYPNPASESITIRINDQTEEHYIEIYNSMGRLINKLHLVSGTQIDVSKLPRGLYFIRLQNRSHRVLRFVKE